MARKFVQMISTESFWLKILDFKETLLTVMSKQLNIGSNRSSLFHSFSLSGRQTDSTLWSTIWLEKQSLSHQSNPLCSVLFLSLRSDTGARSQHPWCQFSTTLRRVRGNASPRMVSMTSVDSKSWPPSWTVSELGFKEMIDLQSQFF